HHPRALDRLPSNHRSKTHRALTSSTNILSIFRFKTLDNTPSNVSMMQIAVGHTPKQQSAPGHTMFSHGSGNRNRLNTTNNIGCQTNRKLNAAILAAFGAWSSRIELCNILLG